MQSGNSSELFLMGTIDIPRTEEIDWHHRFERFRVRGEWYFPTKELMMAIEPHRCEPISWLQVSAQAQERRKEYARQHKRHRAQTIARLINERAAINSAALAQPESSARDGGELADTG